MGLSPVPLTPPPAAGDGLLHRLTASLAHNVNNALTGVVGYFELALRDAAADSPLHENLRAGLACAYQAAATVRQVVAFASASSRPEALEAVALREVAEGEARALDGRTAAVAVAVEGGPTGRVRASLPLLRTALDQLVRNALEAMPSGGTLRLRVEEADRRCALTVEDTGPGLSPEVRLRLFEPFLTTKASGHLGLGLVLAREMTRAQGGTLEVSSAAGRGTAVTLSFPVLDAESAPAAGAQAAPQSVPAGPAGVIPHWPGTSSWVPARNTA